MNTDPRVVAAFFLPNLEGGGAERAIVALANNVAALGIRVDLVLGMATGPYMTEISPAVRVIDLSATKASRVVMRLRRYLANNRPAAVMSSLDVPNVQLILAAKLARFGGTTVIGQRATLGPVYSRLGLVRRTVIRLAMRLAYPRAHSVICNSYAAAGEIRAMSGMRGDRVVTIHNSVDAERIQRLASEPLAEAGGRAEARPPLILSVGSLTHLKDRSTLVRAFAVVKSRRDARLAILGTTYESAERAKVERLIADLGLTDCVHLAGFDSNPYRWMKRAAVLVSSSLTEGCPNQVLEGLALGVPIVATDCPGDTAELLGHGKWGRLVPVSDPARMAEAILAALDDPSPPDGRLRAADFSPAKTTHAYLDVLLSRLDLRPATVRESM
jgi:glycosyltransferase involved in cell wall biosynthesis